MEKLIVGINIIPKPNEELKETIMFHLKVQTPFIDMVKNAKIPLENLLYYLEIHLQENVNTVYISEKEIAVC